ncbi:unnamed protein product [Camellia sinensis]
MVPKGWDKLYVSLLSTETGKTVSKSGKASVQNGTCRWTETLSESVWISQDEAPKEFEQYLFKLVVSMGSARSSILGEPTINLAGYMSSRASIPVSLPLKKCNHGTILQVEIQCLTPRTKSRVIMKETPNLLSRNTPIDEFLAALQGLYDTVFDVDNDKERAEAQGLEPNGFSFDGADAAGVDYAINRETAHEKSQKYKERKSVLGCLIPTNGLQQEKVQYLSSSSSSNGGQIGATTEGNHLSLSMSNNQQRPFINPPQLFATAAASSGFPQQITTRSQNWLH